MTRNAPAHTGAGASKRSLGQLEKRNRGRVRAVFDAADFVELLNVVYCVYIADGAALCAHDQR